MKASELARMTEGALVLARSGAVLLSIMIGQGNPSALKPFARQPT